ncbi:MAG: rod shape-determining protein MreC [Candidatus Magasanikbacteria bacterium]|nr:rod shape-determining protein MreC [Candidatus Magasanikbacteria bacterium]
MKRRHQTMIGIGIVIVIVVVLQLVGALRPIENLIVNLFFNGTQFAYESEVGNNGAHSVNQRLDDTFDPELIQAVCNIETAENVLIKEENEELRKQLNFFSKNNLVHIGAEVIGRTVDPLSTVVTINRGKKDGVISTNPVIVGEGVLVGTVIETFDHISYVRLINDNQSRVGATLLNKDHTIGLVEGGYDIGVQMNFIPQNEVVSPGDIVVTSGLTENMPRGFTIGRVEFVEKQPLEPFQQAILDPLADLSYLTIVSVVITTSTYVTE